MTPVGTDSRPPAGSPIKAVHTVQALRAQVDAWRSKGLKISFVPTMGALHAGHLSLVRKSTTIADRTIASIFINPRQFSPTEDLETYPRNEEHDLKQLAAQGCDLVYVPSRDAMYPKGYQTSIVVPELSQGLCGTSRPHFFGGVATVVCKLLNQCRPDLAVFGEKDYQQLLIIKRMVTDLDIDVKIIGSAIVREKDGLAMSSRNAYLSSQDRATAGHLNRVIAEVARTIASGARADEALCRGRAALLSTGFPSIDYIEVRSADDLTLLGPGVIDQPARVFVATVIGKTRLIDNWPIDKNQ